MRFHTVNTNPDAWFFGAWQAVATGWAGPVRALRWRARLDGVLHWIADR